MKRWERKEGRNKKREQKKRVKADHGVKGEVKESKLLTRSKGLGARKKIVGCEEQKKKREKKKRNWAWAQLIWTPKAQWPNCYSHPMQVQFMPNCSSPIRIGLLYCSQAHSEIGPPENPKPN
jgi:hypothetical protein